MAFNALWEARVPDYADDVLARGLQYKDIISSRLELAIGVEHLRALAVFRAAAA